MNFYYGYMFTLLTSLLIIYDVKADLIDIIGGSAADISQFPYQVSLRFRNRFICGGIIINNRHILTAAHCVCSEDYSACPVAAEDITIAAGSTTLVPNNGVHISIEKIFVHEYYIAKNIHANDIAILQLSERLTFDTKIQSYPLADSTPRDGTECVATGWGMTSLTGNISNYLMHVNISIIGHNSCASTNNIFYKVLCTDRGDKKPYRGDSGGALNCGGRISGIVSAGYPSNLYPTYFTDIARYRRWIDTQLIRNSTTNIKLNFPYYIYVLISALVYSSLRRLLFTITNHFDIISNIIRNIFPWLF